MKAMALKCVNCFRNLSGFLTNIAGENRTTDMVYPAGKKKDATVVCIKLPKNVISSAG
jgi:hypothetical protein